MVEGEAGSVMCAYQGVNGVPMCANGFILNQVVRQDWNWSGFVISDCDAINTMMEAECELQPRNNVTCPGGGGRFGHGYSLGGPEAVRDGLRGGCDANCGDPYSANGMQGLAQGLYDESMLDVSVGRQLRAQIKMGLFDPLENQPWAHLSWKDVGTKAHKQLALEAARQSIVLLDAGTQNTPGGGAILPLQKGLKIAVTGVHYNATASLLGNYRGAVCASPSGGGDSHREPCMVSLNQQIAKLNLGGSVAAVAGVHDTNNMSTAGFGAAVAAAKASDVVVYACGLDSGSVDGPGGQGGDGAGGGGNEGEGTDRHFLQVDACASRFLLKIACLLLKSLLTALFLQLPGAQGALFKVREHSSAMELFGPHVAISSVMIRSSNCAGALFKALQATGKPIVVVLVNGGTVSIDGIQASDASHLHNPATATCHAHSAPRYRLTSVTFPLVASTQVSIDGIAASDAAVLEVFYPGQAGAQAIAEILFGDTNPSGKLDATIYPQVSSSNALDRSSNALARSSNALARSSNALADVRPPSTLRRTRTVSRWAACRGWTRRCGLISASTAPPRYYEA